MTYRIALLACLSPLACQMDDEPGSLRLSPVCIDDEDAPDDAWQCSEPLAIDCNDASVPDAIYVALEPGECADVDLQDVPGPFPPGHYDIVILDANSDDPVCSTELTVTDALAPVIETAELSMWPPNHKYHDIALADCIESVDDCDGSWTAVIDYVSSDEPDDDNGDGHTSADIVLVAPDAVQLRSERQGGSNGRVYTIGFTVTDASGNETPAECLVVVDHDQGNGAAVDDGEAWRVDA